MKCPDCGCWMSHVIRTTYHCDKCNIEWLAKRNGELVSGDVDVDKPRLYFDTGERHDQTICGCGVCGKEIYFAKTAGKRWLWQIPSHTSGKPLYFCCQECKDEWLKYNKCDYDSEEEQSEIEEKKEKRSWLILAMRQLEAGDDEIGVAV